jgi:5-formyltetrahydrofolate cyclo-ligase
VPITKNELRATTKAARSRLPDKDERSATILRHVVRLAEYEAASRVGFYVDVRDEVRTRSLLAKELESANKSIVVPYCEGSLLRLVEIRSISDLGIGTFGILEPQTSLRQSHNRHVEITDLDAILVPGVAFSRQGDRIGYGAGYYDRLLSSASRVTKIGLAFDCQLVDEIPTDRFDVRMDYICAENGSIACRS